MKENLMAGGRPSAAVKTVMVIAANAETLVALRSYFSDVGIESFGTAELPELALAAATTGVVIFPDDFKETEVVAYLKRLRASGPERALVVVTSDVQRFKDATSNDGASLNVVVLPRPSFSWAILDSVKSPATRSPDRTT
jgi:hypothetical protein